MLKKVEGEGGEGGSSPSRRSDVGAASAAVSFLSFSLFSTHHSAFAQLPLTRAANDTSYVVLAPPTSLPARRAVHAGAVRLPGRGPDRRQGRQPRPAAPRRLPRPRRLRPHHSGLPPRPRFPAF